ncbi:MAG: glycosyltransferase family 9 protein [Planctomycetota bacterium]
MSLRESEDRVPPLTDMLRLPLQAALTGALRGGRPLFERWAQPGYFQAGLPPRVERVLVLTSGSLRAGIWNVAVFEALARRLPEGAELWVACRQRELPLWEGRVPGERQLVLAHLAGDPRLDRGTSVGLWQEGAALRDRRFDLILDLCGTRASAALSFLARPRRALGCASGGPGTLYSRPPSEVPPDWHRALRAWSVVEAISGWAPSQPPPPLPLVDEPDPGDRSGRRAWAVDGLADFTVLVPGDAAAALRWPRAGWASLAHRLAARGPLVVLGRPDEEELLQALCAAAPSAIPVLPGPLRPAAWLLGQARAVLVNDGQWGHVAAAQGAPVLTLFGGSNPKRVRPLGGRCKVLRSACPYRPEGGQAGCRGAAEPPCTEVCWSALTPERVLEALEQLAN